MNWLWRWLPHRLSRRQSLTSVLVRTLITQMIFFNQGMLLLGSNHFLKVKQSSCNSTPPVCNSNATRSLFFVTPLAVKLDKLEDRFQRFHRTAKFVGLSLGLKQGSPLASVLNKLSELGAYSPLNALSLFDEMSISKKTLRIYKTLEITFPNGDKDLYPRRQCNLPVRLSQHNVFTTQLVKPTIFHKSRVPWIAWAI